MASKEISSGSLKELWRVTFPLMISQFSLFAMLCVDRFFLARYSTEALNAASSAGTFCWAIIVPWMTLAIMVEVFVSQYNGAKQYERIGSAVWQMIWLSALSLLFFIPMALWGNDFLYGGKPSPYELEYGRWMMWIAPPFILTSALSAFYVGQGKTSIIRWLALLGNGINVILDPILIFGIEGWVKPLGIPGACIATGIGTLVQCGVLFFCFLSKENRLIYGTREWKFSWKKLQAAFKVGIPPSIAAFSELLGWAAFYWMMAQISKEHIISASISQSILFLFLFFGFGLEKGAATVAGNLIGAGKHHLIRRLIQSCLYLIALYALVLLFFFVLFPDFMLNIFLDNPRLIEGVELDSPILQATLKARVQEATKWGFIMCAIYLVLENIRWAFSGILTAAGDTLFLMIANVSTVWLLLILPTYFFVVLPKASIAVAFEIWVVYAGVAALLNIFRFLQGKWKKNNLLETTSPPLEEASDLAAPLLQSDPEV